MFGFSEIEHRRCDLFESFCSIFSFVPHAEYDVKQSSKHSDHQSSYETFFIITICNDESTYRYQN